MSDQQEPKDPSSSGAASGDTRKRIEPGHWLAFWGGIVGVVLAAAFAVLIGRFGLAQPPVSEPSHESPAEESGAGPPQVTAALPAQEPGLSPPGISGPMAAEPEELPSSHSPASPAAAAPSPAKPTDLPNAPSPVVASPSADAAKPPSEPPPTSAALSKAPNVSFGVARAKAVWAAKAPNEAQRLLSLQLTLTMTNQSAAPVRFIPRVRGRFDVVLQNGSKLDRSSTPRESVCVSPDPKGCRATVDSKYVEVAPGRTGEFDLSLRDYVAIGSRMPVDGYASGSLNLAVMIDTGASSDVEVTARAPDFPIDVTALH